MSSHEHFEELCALAALGDISEGELSELRAHLGLCASCQEAYEEFAEIAAKRPARLEVTREPFWKAFDLSYRSVRRNSAFARRAEQQGIQFSEGACRRIGVRPASGLWLFTAYKVVVALTLFFLLIVAGYLGHKLRESNERDAIASAENARLQSELGSLRCQLAEIPQPTTIRASESPVKPQPSLNNKDRRVADSKGMPESGLAQDREDRAAAPSQTKALEEQLRNASAEIETLKAEAVMAKNSEGQFVGKLREAEHSISQLTDELQRLRNTQSEDASAKAEQEARINDLSERLKAQTEDLDRERKLLAAGRDIRDLMSARNLHIIDVYDVDSKGKTKQAFGRVFYTEGKSLIFYAFDLAGKGSAASTRSYQAWGRQESDDSAPYAAKSLGIFYADDQKQNRWVLKFNDPDILARIDYVFVTVEPSGGSRKPSGQKLLYAYLKQKPNHP